MPLEAAIRAGSKYYKGVGKKDYPLIVCGKQSEGKSSYLFAANNQRVILLTDSLVVFEALQKVRHLLRRYWSDAADSRH